MLKVEGLTKIYRNAGEEVRALNDVSLEIFPGEFAAIVGPSGSGKSTLLHVMGGLEAPTEGEVIFEDKRVYLMKDKELSAWRNKNVGFVFQFYHLIEELNVLENIAMAAIDSPRKTSFKKAAELLEYLGISGRGNFFPSQLSGGEKQKTVIARAVMNQPRFILCDEPTGSLDVDSQAKVVELLRGLNREMKKTVVMVTHNQVLAKKADRILFIDAGRLSRAAF